MPAVNRAQLALAAVRTRPGCSAWALGVLAPVPDGVDAREWRALLEAELPKLHAAGKVEATREGVGTVRYWPPRAEIPTAAGPKVPPATEAA